jgi:hypothetical protein
VSKGKLDTFKPQRRNANKHTQRGLGALETSIQKDGWIGAITVAADGETFDGSARIEVGASTGFDDVIVVESDGTKPIVHRRIDIPTADDPRAVRLGYAANRVAALNLDFDPAVILADLDAGLDLSALWNEGELNEIAKEAGRLLAKGEDAGPQIDKADELRVKWGTALGQVWELGEHRLVCGDCTDRAAVEAVMRGDKADITMTDPPYGVGMEYGMHEDKPEENEGLVIAAFSFGPDSKIWTPGLKNLARELIREPRAGVLAWNRRFSLGWPPHGCSWATIWEPILVTKPLVRKLKTDHFEYMTEREAAPGNVGGTLHDMHPCPKPVALWTEVMEGLSDAGMIIYEPFSGTGTTLIVSERLGRKCRAVEVDVKYVAVSIQRWHDMTGREPRLVG